MPATAKSSAQNDDAEDFYLEEAVFYPYLQIISEKSGNKSKLFPDFSEINIKKARKIESPGLNYISVGVRIVLSLSVSEYLDSIVGNLV